MTDDMIAVMDELDLKSAHIVGHSTGAVMAQDMAMRYPDRIRSAVMYSGWARKDSYFQRCFDVRKRVLLDSGPLAYVQTTPLFLMSPWYVSKNINEIEAGAVLMLFVRMAQKRSFEKLNVKRQLFVLRMTI